jgi:hypothetical protein
MIKLCIKSVLEACPGLDPGCTLVCMYILKSSMPVAGGVAGHYVGNIGEFNK